MQKKTLRTKTPLLTVYLFGEQIRVLVNVRLRELTVDGENRGVKSVLLDFVEFTHFTKFWNIFS
jgi:hypothetical protein